MRAGLAGYNRAGLIGGGTAIAILVLGMVGAMNQRQLAGLPVGNVLVGAIVLMAGYRAARDSGGWRRRLVGGLMAGFVAGAFFAVFVLITRVPGVSEKLVQTRIEITDVVFLGLGLPGAAVLVVMGAVLGGLGGLAGAATLRSWRPARLAGARRVAGPARFAPRTLLALFVFAVALIVAPMFVGQYWNHVSSTVGIFVLMGLGLNVVVGYAGLLDLGYVAFFAIGAYAMAILTAPDQGVEMNFWPALLLAMVISGISGTLLGIPVLRMRGDYLAIVTLGFGEIIRIFSQNLTELTGGPQGVRDIARPALGGTIFDTPQPYFYLIATGVVLAAIVSAQMLYSRVGRAWVAMREDEDVARAIGIRVVRYKLLAFTIGAVFAGLGGAIFASRQSSIFPNDFTLIISINVLCLVIIGGMGSVRGVIVGSVALIALPEVLRELSEFRLVTFGALLVFMMIVRPGGLMPASRSLVSRPRSLDIAVPAPER